MEGKEQKQEPEIPNAVQEQKIIAKMYLDYLAELLTICLNHNVKVEPSLTKVQRRSIGLKSAYINSSNVNQYIDISEEAKGLVHELMSAVLKTLLDRAQQTEESVLDLSDLGLDLSECKIMLGDVLDVISEADEEKMPPLNLIDKAFSDVKTVQNMANKKNEEYDSIVKEISKAEAVVAELKTIGLDASECEKILDNANIALLTENFALAQEQAHLAVEAAEKAKLEGPKKPAEPKPELPRITDDEIDRILPQINDLHKEISVKIELLRANNLDVAPLEAGFEAGKNAITAKDYRTAISTLMNTKVQIDNRYYEEINRMIRSTADSIRKAPSQIILSEPMNYLNRASQLLIDNEYIQAYENAKRSEELVRHIVEEYKSIQKIIQLCEVKVKALKKENLDLTQIELALGQAKDFLKKSQHKDAIDKANVTLLQIEESKKPLTERYKAKIGEALDQIEPMIKELKELGLEVRDVEWVYDEMVEHNDDATQLEDYKSVLDYALAVKAEIARTVRRTEIKDRQAEARYFNTKERYNMLSKYMSLPIAKKALQRIQDAMVSNQIGVISKNMLVAETLMLEAVEKYFPEFSCEIFGEAILKDQWCNMNVRLLNYGFANAQDVMVKITGDFKINQEPYPLNLRFGESYTIPLGMLFPMEDEIPVQVQVDVKREYDGVPMTLEAVGKIFKDKTGHFTTSSIPLRLTKKGEGTIVREIPKDPGQGTKAPGAVPPDQCSVCKAQISSGSPKVTCGCGAGYHVNCFSKLSYCMECGRVLGG